MEEVMRTMPVMCYAEIAEIDAEHEVFLVRHISSGRIGVRKGEVGKATCPVGAGEPRVASTTAALPHRSRGWGKGEKFVLNKFP